MKNGQALMLLAATCALASCGQDTATTATTTGDGGSPLPPETPLAVSNDDIRGKVVSANGPEAGVWVIAETRDLGTRFARIVVTNDDGDYVIPDLPSANYDIWVRGYGLVDSPKVQAEPGATLDLQAVVAPDAAAAAQYYPAGYWFSLLEIPGEDQFPGTGPTGNGISPLVKHQADYIRLVTSGGCVVCHQLGNLATRTIPALFNGYDSSAEAWARRRFRHRL